MLFDGDAAGKAAQARAMETFLNEDVVVRGITLPDEYDPDEFVKEKGHAALADLLKNAPYLLDQRILEIASEAGGHTEGKVRAVDQILPWIAKIPSETARFARIQNLSAMFSISADALERRVQQLAPATKGRPQQFTSRGVSSMKSKDSLDPTEERFLEVIVAFPNLILTAEGIDRAVEGIQSELVQNQIQILLDFIKNKASLGPQIEFDAEILESVKSAEIKRILSKALVTSEQEKGKDFGSTERLEELKQEFKDLVSKLNRRAMEKRRDYLRTIILKADSSGNKAEVQNLVQEYNELVKKLM